MPAIEFDDKMLGLDQRIVGQHVEHFEHIADPNVERIDRECFAKRFARGDFIAQPHVDHAEIAAWADQLRHEIDGGPIKLDRVGIALQTVESGSHCCIKLAAMRITSRHFGNQAGQCANRRGRAAVPFDFGLPSRAT